MIGPLLTARYMAKKPWGVSAIFFVILLVLGLIMSMFLGFGPVISLVIGAIVFVAVALYYLKVPVLMAIGMLIVSTIINWIFSWVLQAFSGMM